MPEFRAKLADTQLNLDHPVWVEDKNFDLSRHLYRIGLPSPGGRRELAGSMRAYRGGAPGSEQTGVGDVGRSEGVADTDAHDGGTLALMIKVHHAAVDGVTATEPAYPAVGTEPDFSPS